MQAADEAERRLAAILAADVAGYSRHVAVDDRAALARLTEIRRIAGEEVSAHRGVMVDTAGDSCLAHFASVTDAVTCAVAVQRRLASLNALQPAEGRMELRIGIHVGDLLMRGREVFGDGVNIAARLQAEATPGGICLSAASREHLSTSLGLGFEELGELALKNIDRPVRAYRVVLEAKRAAEAPALTLPEKPSIAVLPFTNMSGDPEQEYFADGITEDIITALSRVRWFFVIARNSTFTYKGRAVDVRQVGRELGVRYVLEGSVRKAGNRLRITGQLIEAEAGRHVWAERYDGTLEDVFDLQDRITEEVAGAIEPNLQRAEIQRAGRRKPTESIDAYDLVLRALPLVNELTREANTKAIEALEQAIQIDPDYAYAIALLSQAYRVGTYQHWRNGFDIPRAEELGRRALRLGQDDAGALAEVSGCLATLSRDWDAALTAVTRSLTLNPYSATGQAAAGHVRIWREEPIEALPHFDKAIRFSPVDIQLYRFFSGKSIAYMQLQDWDSALSWAQKSCNIHPGWAVANRVKIISLVQLGRLEEARSAASEFLQTTPGFTVSGHAKGNSFRTEKHWRVWMDSFRAAGLPE